MKVSIIVPVYNAEKYLAACVESILNQTYSDLEVILVNDGSLDKSLELAKSYEFKDKRVLVLDKENGGVSTARNMGIDHASGDYITFIDSDDTIPETSIMSLVNNMTDDVDEVLGRFYWQYDERIIKRYRRIKPGIYTQDDLLSGFIDDGTLSGFLISSNCCTLYRLSIIKSCKLKFDEGLKINEDGLFNFCYFLHSRGVHIIEDHVYTTRKHIGSSSRIRPKEYDFNSIVCKKIDSLDWDKQRYDEAKQFERRKLTVLLWNVLLYPVSMGFWDGRSYIKEEVRKINMKHATSLLDYNRINKFKKVLLFFMNHHLYSCVYIIVHYVIPKLSSKFNR